MSTSDSTVFVVDDDLQFCTSLVRILKSSGLSARAFTSAEELLDEYEADAPGCLVVDLAMPGVDGLELQAALRDEGSARPIVFLTGRGDVQASVRAMKQGAVDFLTKPVDESVLLEAVHSALEEDARRRADDAERTEFLARWRTLTSREREVAWLVIAGRLNKQIASELGVVQRTVKFHRHHMMTKLGVGSVGELAQLVTRSDLAPP